MLHVGLTGGIGSGKSTVAALLREKGAETLDADRMVREMLAPGGEAVEPVLGAFGGHLRDGEGGVDRRALAALAFADPAARARLEALLHPRVIARRRALLEEIARRRGPRTVVVSEAALIFEAGTQGEFDATVLVTAPREVRLQRLAAAGWDPVDAERRMAAQWDDDRKAALADFVVDNGGGLDRTRAEVDRLWGELVRRLQEPEQPGNGKETRLPEKGGDPRC
ncbi:MAG: dephospho-CoA kinase [Acidobacteriota bacterium]